MRRPTWGNLRLNGRGGNVKDTNGMTYAQNISIKLSDCNCIWQESKEIERNRLYEKAQPRLRVVGLLPLGVEVAVDFPDEAAIGIFSLCLLLTDFLAGAFQ